MAVLTLRPGTAVRHVDAGRPAEGGRPVDAGRPAGGGHHHREDGRHRAGGLVVGTWRSTTVIPCPPMIGEVWRRLAPALHRGLDPETAVAGLPAATGTAVRWLLGRLADHDALVDAAVARDDHPLAAYLAGVADEPAAALAAVRRAVVAVAGGGEPAAAIVAALVEAGITARPADTAAGADLVVQLDGAENLPAPGRYGVLRVAGRVDGVLIGATGGTGAADHPVAGAVPVLPVPPLVTHEVVRTLAGLADGTAALVAGPGVRRVPPDAPVPVGARPGWPAAHPHPPGRQAGHAGRAVSHASGEVGGEAGRADRAVSRAGRAAGGVAGADEVPVRGDAAVLAVGPLTGPAEGVCPACVDARRRAVLGPLAGGGPAVPLPLPGYWARLADAVTAEHRAGRFAPGTVTVLALRDGTVAQHRVRSLPGCPTCDPLPDDRPELVTIALRPRGMADPDRLRVAAAPPALPRLREALVDPWFGPVVRVHPERCGPVSLAAAELTLPELTGVTGVTGLAGLTGLTGAPAVPETSGLTGTPGARVTSGMPERLGGFGRAAEPPAAESLALLEALEREAGRHPQSRRTVVHGGYRELAADAVDPVRLGLPEPASVAHPDYRLAAYTPETATRWVWAYALTGGDRRLVPEDAAYWGVARPDAERFLRDSSSGCAVGGCREEALLHACLEVIERDAFLLTWYGRQPPTAVTHPVDADPMTRRLHARLRDEGYALHLFDITSDVGVPAVWALAVTGRPDRPASFSAAGAHPDPRRAAAAAIVEAGVNLLQAGRRPAPARDRLVAMLDDPALVRRLPDHAALHQLPAALPRFDFALRGGPPRPFEEHFAGGRERWRHPDLTEVLRRVVDAMAAAGIAPLAVEQTRTVDRRLGLAVVKVLAPGAVPMTFGHLNRRVDLPRLRRVRADPGAADLPHPFP